jgi:hypothetical protein
MSLPFDYITTSNAAGSFTIQTDGIVQGTLMDDPAARWALRSGVINSDEVLPMWGGVGIYEHVPNLAAGNPDNHLGNIIGRATTLTATNAKGLSGFSMFNQTHNAVIDAANPVPRAAPGMTFNYIRLGTGARICVAADPALASLEGGVVGAQVGWDFNAQRLAPFTNTATYAITSAVWAADNGGELTIVMTVPSTVGAVGDSVTISGATNTGTGGAAAINQTFLVTEFTDASNFVLAAPAAVGVYGTIAGSPVVVEGTGALACRVDAILPGNSMIVAYNGLTTRSVWNYSGTGAIITI